jgi:hypothetical protein
MLNTTHSNTVIDGTTSQSTKPACGQVAGYSANAGIQLMEIPREAGQHFGLVRYAVCIFGWIPAFAGMTDYLELNNA